MARHIAGLARLSARFQLILAVALGTGACTGGCSSVNRPVQSPSRRRAVRLSRFHMSELKAAIRRRTRWPRDRRASASPAPAAAVSEDAALASPADDSIRHPQARRRRLSLPVRLTRCSSRYSERRRRRIGLRFCWASCSPKAGISVRILTGEFFRRFATGMAQCVRRGFLSPVDGQLHFSGRCSAEGK